MVRGRNVRLSARQIFGDTKEPSKIDPILVEVLSSEKVSVGPLVILVRINYIPSIRSVDSTSVSFGRIFS